ncbi:MAG: hypothetical protein HYV29_15170 [Ignavibacteriales bacterium]|nr:hypothetical protein [Ignavibacteriales bacterium]
MKKISLLVIVVVSLVIGGMFIGCDKEENPTGSTPGSGNGIFKTAGTFSFSSDRGNFSVNGIFDTLFLSTNASGAFQYTEDGANLIFVYAYDMRDTSNVRVVFSGVVDTLTAVSTGTYSFEDINGSRFGIFGYMADITDAAHSAFYILTSGGISVSTLTTSTISGTFSGNGFDAFDTLNTIAVTNGSFNTPIVEKYFGYGRDDAGLVQERIKAMVHRELFK